MFQAADLTGKETDLDSSDIVWMDGGRTHVGTDRPEIRFDGESPRRQTTLRAFGISRFAVTVAEFARFIDESGWMTSADRFGWSYVFRGLSEDATGPRPRDLPWWNAIDGANWRCPAGPSGDRAPGNHPVTHVSHADAMAYAAWAGGRLATEPEWEHAARGGSDNARYPWGDAEPDDDRNIFCNIWQGEFPDENTVRDGFYGTAPVDAFEPNPYGLFNMSGNVWEWCADRFRVRSVGKAARVRNKQAIAEREHVLKGGSFLCHKSYCWRYRIAARSGRPGDTSACNSGFRLAFDA
ncbi:MAG: SUMF1/EgtB/PvdO family nonheme iron enzyme [Rhodobacteraceae bacterium]|nr:SUMF1/EgtB/PvdO family nonheme iron enzyme [Paracoccaceae bacterium]MCY4137491.1 SUMF1/EgtB/PvdO family nonheme iron enzyme [Paracoccaceae bacterium]